MDPLRLSDAASAEGRMHGLALIRGIEEALAEAKLENRFDGPLHVSIGQEAIAVALGLARGPDDVLLSSHRGHHHALAWGLDPVRVIAEIVGDATGYCGGRGGSMHILSLADRFLGTNGIVGASVGLGVGAALAQRQGDAGVAFAVTGDGSMATGIVHESLNMAALWSLPLVIVCENNGYAEMTPTDTHLASSPAASARAAGFEVVQVDGRVLGEVEAAIAWARSTAQAGRPCLVEATCNRWGGHYVGDPQHYRDGDRDWDAWVATHCPLQRTATDLDHPPDALAVLVDGFREQARAVVERLTPVRARGRVT